MKKQVLVVLFFMLLGSTLLAQDKSSDEGKFGIKFKGFVKTDVMFDSRQTVAARESHFLLYPANENLDINGDDINAKANLNMLAVQTRLTGVITGPDVCNAKTSGVIEGAFFGHSDIDINGFRLRHAFLKLSWEKSSLLMGQYWHPMFVVEVFPGVISFNTGAPFQPFSRNPQIRFTHKLNDLNVSVTAASQRDFTSTGPSGGSSIYLRNSAMPMMNVELKYLSQTFVAGVSGNYKTLLPKLASSNGTKTDEKISSFAAMGFAKLVQNDLTIKVEGVYGSDMYDLLMLGGYALKTAATQTAVETYTGLKIFSAWTEFIYGKDLQFGLFAGYTENLGADDEILSTSYARGANIANIMRVSPRVQYSIGKARFAAEIEYTTAAYGTQNNKGKVEDTNDVSNLRILLASYLFF